MRARARARACVCVCVCARAYVYVCVCARARVCVRARTRMLARARVCAYVKRKGKGVEHTLFFFFLHRYHLEHLRQGIGHLTTHILSVRLWHADILYSSVGEIDTVCLVFGLGAATVT